MFLADFGNRSTFSVTLLILLGHFGIFLEKRFPCNGGSTLFMVPFSDKGFISLLSILETYQAEILDQVVYL